MRSLNGGIRGTIEEDRAVNDPVLLERPSFHLVLDAVNKICYDGAVTIQDVVSMGRAVVARLKQRGKSGAPFSRAIPALSRSGKAGAKPECPPWTITKRPSQERV
jgi:hypothetical protein